MAKWGIRFQRFALSFRLSALDVCRTSRVAHALRGFTRANEKFHLFPISQYVNMAEIIGKFGGADQLRNAVNQLQMVPYAA